MKLKQYINEAPPATEIFLDIEDISDAISRECKPYLKLIKGKDPLYRGMSKSNRELILKHTRKDRMPRGMSQSSADRLNSWLEKNGHCRRDESVLATPVKKHTKVFGHSYMIFPIGKFKYTFIKAKDFNMDDKKTGWYKYADLMFFNNPGEEDDMLPMPFPKYFVSNKGWDEMYNKGYEVWIECDKYYAVLDTTQWVWDSKYQVFV